ncbi:MAG: DUF2267 domain-containing protein [Anaerolineae bacterium]|nr:DUF2267 domain-containing protein [Anaerolineae bacterium]
MDELVKLISQKAGISEDQARSAAQTILDFLKQKLPAPVFSQIEGLLSSSGKIDDLAKGIGGLFGKK